MNIHHLYNTLKTNKENASLPKAHDISATDEQIGSYLVFLNHFKPVGYQEHISHFSDKKPIFAKITSLLNGNINTEEFMDNFLANTLSKDELGDFQIQKFIQNFTADNLNLPLVSAWLAAVYVNGISESDTLILTRAMRDSGNIFDYRGEHHKLIRRYPSGALSEKTALILPSLLSATNKEYPIQSPFLVAKSLGFTGGTWDKLSSVPNFTFPRQGQESITAMKECGVSMTVTLDELCPADRKMYQLRSATGTVESLELAVASIASKQLAVPSDYLLMDVRTGDGAFFNDPDEAQMLGEKIKSILEQDGIKTDFVLTKMDQPDGSAIGNFLEVEEAIYLMGGSSSIQWNKKAISEQKERVISFYSKLMKENFGHDKIFWDQYAEKLFEDGTVLKSFGEVLKSHKVAKEDADNIIKHGLLNTLEKHGYSIETHKMQNSKKGNYSKINQRELGTIINFDLGVGSNDYHKSTPTQTGVIINARLHDFVDEKKNICGVITLLSPNQEPKNIEEFIPRIKKCFDIS